MRERTRVKIIGGAACRKGKIGVVITKSEVKSQESGVTNTELVQNARTDEINDRPSSSIRTNKNNSQTKKLLTREKKKNQGGLSVPTNPGQDRQLKDKDLLDFSIHCKTSDFSLLTSKEIGTGKNIGKVEIYIDRLGNYWYDPKDLEIIEESKSKTTKEKFTVGFYDVDPAELKPHPANPKIYGESDEDISDLIQLICSSGFDERLIVNTKGEIVSGNRRNRTALKLELATVPIEVKAFESIEEEIRFLLSKNTTRTKTVFQKVREGHQGMIFHGVFND